MSVFSQIHARIQGPVLRRNKAKKMSAFDATKPLPPSRLNQPRSPIDRSSSLKPDADLPEMESADNILKDIKKGQEARERSARVEAGEMAKSTRIDKSYAAKASAQDGASRSGGLSDRGTVKKGRSYYDPARIANRAVRRREKFERQRFGL